MPTMTESILDLCTDVRAQVNLKNSSNSPSANRQSSASRYRDSLCINIRATAPLLIPHEVSEATTLLCQAEPRSNEGEEQGHSLRSSKQITAKQVRSMINNARSSHNLGDSALHTVKLSLVEDFRREWPSIIRDAAQQAFEELKRYIRSYIDIHLDQYAQIKVLVENTVDPLAHKFYSTLSEQLSTLLDQHIVACRDHGCPQLEVPGECPANASLLQTAGISSDTVSEPVPLQMSTNRWVANSIARQGQTTSGISQAMVAGKVLALLNKLSPSNFDSISDQIIVWANVSENERDARTLHQIVTIIYDNAIDEASRSELYARLCRKMMEQISPKVMEVGVQTIDGRNMAGGHLFRKHILNRAQEEFERGWSFAELVMTSKLFSDEYYTAQKTRRRSIGYITFLGELFKLRMLTKRIMHECVKRLLVRGESDLEYIEGLCTLLNTIGSLLDTPKARAHMDVYFSRMKEIEKQPKMSLRLRFMLLNTIELRERNWIPRANKLVQAAVISIPRTARMNTSQYLGTYTGRGGRTLTRFDLYRNASSGERASGQSGDPHVARLYRHINNPTSAHMYKDTVPYDALPTHPDSTSQLVNTEDRGDSGVKTHLFPKPSSVFQSHADSTTLDTPCPSSESAPSYCTSGSAKKEAFNELSTQHATELLPISTYEEELQLMADVRTCFKGSSERVIHDVSRVIDEHMLAFVEELQTRLLSAMGLELMVPRRTTQ